VKLLRAHGAHPRYYHHVVGTNSRLDALQAAVLRVKLKHLDTWIAARQAHAAVYDRDLLRLTGLVSPYQATDRTHTYHQYTVRVHGEYRDALQKFLRELDVGTALYYPVPLHLQPALQHLCYRPGDFPIAEQASAQVLSLPMFPELRMEEQEYVAETIQRFCHTEQFTTGAPIKSRPTITS
jgi:dTDP-4-amino-4,6-dideoxygalactose transaminase